MSVAGTVSVVLFVAGATVLLVGALVGADANLPDRSRRIAWRVSLIGLVPLGLGLVGAVAAAVAG